MRPKGIKFVVEGSGEFPFDMLRYDACYPLNERDSYKLRSSSDVQCRRRVVLKSLNHPTTSGRWESYGWRVVVDARHEDAQIEEAELEVTK